MPILPPRLLTLLDAFHLRVPLRTAVFGTIDFYRRLKIPFIRRTIRRLEAKKRAELAATGRKIKVCFACIDKSQWIFQSVYDAFKSDPRYEVSLLRCRTWVRNNDKSAADEMKSFFDERNMPTIDRLDDNNLPDVMFLPRFDPLAYNGMFDPLKLYKQVLFCLTIYAWITPDCDKAYFGRFEESYLWKYFVFNQRDKDVCSSFRVIPEADIIISGFPRNDEFYRAISEVTEARPSNQITVIWAPHWSVLTHNRFSNFDRYAYPLLKWLKQHPTIKIILKPHPFLRARLTDPDTIKRLSFNNPNFQTPNSFTTESEYDAFMREWDALPNGEVMNSGDYSALFAKSDAMVLDSGSYLGEYMFFNKPMCFCNRDRTYAELMAVYNDFGKDLFTGIQIANNFGEITEFLKSLIKGNDPLRAQRESIRAKYLCTNVGKVGESIRGYLEEVLIGK